MGPRNRAFERLSSSFGLVSLSIQSRIELITLEILAAERLRLMGFDNRLIIDCSSNIVNILIYGNFLQMIDSEVRNMNALLGKFISRNEMCQFIIKNTSQ